MHFSSSVARVVVLIVTVGVIVGNWCYCVTRLLQPVTTRTNNAPSSRLNFQPNFSSSRPNSFGARTRSMIYYARILGTYYCMNLWTKHGKLSPKKSSMP